MLATPWLAPFDGDDWWFEVKWDGYRCLITTRSGRSDLRSRRGIDLADRFPEVAALDLPPGWVLDGEVVVLDEEGRSDFSRLQAGDAATLVVFDVLASPDGPTVSHPLEDRWERLENCEIPAGAVVHQPIRGEGTALFEATRAAALEGIVAKRAGSIYQPGRRSADWRKVAHRNRLKAVVGGWLPGEGGRATSFGSLLLGLWREGDLIWIGAVGSGFTDAHFGPFAEALLDLQRPTTPFAHSAGIPRHARWVEPGIVVEVLYKELTRDGHLRAPVFVGISDQEPSAVTWEAELG